MIKLGVARKFIAILANTSLLFNSFVPFLLAAQPVYAQEAIIPEIVVPTLAPEPTAIPVEEPTITPEPPVVAEVTPEITPEVTPEPTITPEPTPSIDPINVEIGVLTPPVGEIIHSPEPSIEISVNPELTPTPENIVTPEATPTETPVFEKVCLTDKQIKDTTNEEWVVEDVNGISETKGKVQLGVRYVYPQENKVSVTFKCLPKDESLRTSLKIEKVKTADLNLPDAMGSVGEYAYDITTGMKDGDFEYDLTLPKPENSTAEISYIAKSIDEAKSNLTFFDINKIEDSKTEQSIDTVKAVSIDHFTIYIVSATLTTVTLNNQTQVTVYPNDSINATLNVDLSLWSGWKYSGWKIDSGSWNIVDTPDYLNSIGFVQHFSNSFNITAPSVVGTYDVSFKVCPFNPDNNCKIISLPNGIIVQPIVVCGNGTIEINEQCDDGNNIDGDGCNSTCQWENGTLLVKKHVVNDNGGLKNASDFTLNIGGTLFSGSENGTLFTLPAGSYSVGETLLPGYTQTSNECSNINLIAGESQICTITNDDQEPTLTLIKSWSDVYNSGYTINDWTLSAAGIGSTLILTGQGSVTGNVLIGTYTLTESGPVGTNSSVWDCTGGATLNGDVLTISLGQNITCTITNTPIQPKLTVIKQVIGSTEPISNFSLFVDSTPVISGVQNGFNVGTYTVNETPNPNYSIGFSGDCNSNGSVSLNLGDNKTCTITNTRNTGTLISHKFEDKNNNEVQDQGENNLSGWDMNLYRGSDCRSGNYLRDLDTNISGNANFGSLVTGDYSIKETLKSGWKNTTQLCQNVTVVKNTTSTVNFGNYRLGSITIKKDTDPDQGGNIKDRTHFDYTGSLGDGTFYDEDTDTFENLPIGQYTITEAVKSGWILTNINCSDNTGVTKDIVNRTVTIELTADKNITCTFKNLKLGRIEGYKFNDINANGVKNSGENKLSGWTITLDKNRDGSIEATTVTDVNGNYKFDNLTPGWYRVCEVPQTDWHSTLFGGAICRDTEIHNNGGDVDEIIFANRKLGSINVCKVITDTEGNVVNGSEVLGSTFTIDWNMGLIDTIFTSNYTPNTDLFSDVAGNDAYCVLYDNLPIDSYRYSQESISGGPSVWQIPLYNDQYKTTVNSLNDFYSYGQNTDSNGEINLALDAGVHRTLVILNQYKFGSISGQKFNDLNGNGQKDEGEVGIENWVINLDKAADGLVDATTVTDANGNYLFDKLTPGSYRLREVNQNGWNQTTSDPDDININAGDKISGIDFGNVQFGSVNVTKFNDANGNGQYDDGENVLSGWDINLSSTTKTTGENGQVLFDGLNPDTYYLSENIKNGWKQTNIYCEDSGPGVLITQPGEAYGHHGMCEGWNNCGDAATCALWACEVNGYDQLVSYGEDRPCTQFDNCHLFNYRGSVQYNWGNWCDVRGVTDIKCSNRSINITPTATPTSALTPTPTSKVANAQEISEETGYKINLSAGQNTKCYIGNQLILPTATISKTNNVTGDLSPGSSVQYTINLSISGNDVTGFSITDLLSNGFKYRAGSYKVTKNGLSYSIPEPEYHSPGVWNLGNLQAGDELELTYIADISADQQAGTYFDLTYGKGQAAYGDKGPVIALNNSDQFVGTQVPIIKSNQNSVSAGVERTEIISGQVLGASTEMPSTGAATIWLAISGLLGIAGFSLLKISKKTMLTIFLTILSFGLLINPVKIQAADLLVKLEIPKSPTNFKEVDLKFVTLDISGGSIIAKCFKKGPNDSAFSQFGSDIVLNNGGNSASCVLSSVINDSGSYQFYVTANSVASNIVNLDYKNSTPDTPYDYRKEKINNCDYKIHFKTGNDSGKTVKVEVYRADITNFILNDGSKIAGINIGSDQEYNLTNSVPDCNKEYYYVLRAFDDAGNGSGTVGDRITVNTIIENNTINTTDSVSEAIPLVGSNNIPQEGEIKEGDDSSSDSQSGSILGTEKINPKSFINQFRTYINNHKFFSILLAISLLAIINYGVKKVRGKRK